MATAEKENIFNVSGSNEIKDDNKNSSKVSDDENKEIIKLNIASQEKNSNSKIIKEKSEEMENIQNNSKSSENKSGEFNFKNTEEKEILNTDNNNIEEKNENQDENENSEIEENKSSFEKSNDDNNNNKSENDEMNGINEENEKDDYDEDNDNKNIKRQNPFMTTGKFMQIQPHFNVFSKQIGDLRDGIYDNTKKCLMYKCSLQHSENFMREKANSIVKDMVEKIFNLRQMFLKSDKEISNIIKETDNNTIKLIHIQDKAKNEIKECDFRINNCERKIGYKLLGKPNYSFMKRVCQTTTNDK